MSALDVGASWLYLAEGEPYRQQAAFEAMRWQPQGVRLASSLVAACPLGGPVAVARDPRKVTAFRRGGESVGVFTAAGKLLAEVEAAGDGAALLQLHWHARAGLLYLLYASGLVEAFDALGARSDRGFSLLPGLTEEEVTQFAFAGDALCALSVSPEGAYSLHLVYSLASPSPLVARDTGLAPGVRPTCMAALDGACTASGRMEVLLGTPDRSVVVVTSDSAAEDAGLEALLSSVVLQLAVSPSNKYLAAFGEDGMVTVLAADFSRKVLEFETRAAQPPEQMLWCADDAVVLVWADRSAGCGSGGGEDGDGGGGGDDSPERWQVQLVGPFGDFLRIDYEDASGGGVFCVQELDCVRVLTGTRHEVIQRVAEPLRAIFSIGSTAPAAMLVDASNAFQEGDAKCDDTIRALIADGRLRGAIGECVEGALHAWDPSHQQALLRAASYGKSFEPAFPREAFVDACRKLRVLNHVRGSDVACPLTHAQLEALTPQALVDRLVARHEHRLALLVCDYLALPGVRDRVLVHWACAKVRASNRLADEAVRDLLRAKLAGVASVSYADIAATADGAGRRKLATMLLGFEPRAADQVPILLRMREGRLALEKALQAGDTDLIHQVLTTVRRALRAGPDVGFKEGGGAAARDGGGRDGGRDGGGEDGGGGGGGGVIGPLDPGDEDAGFIATVLNYPQAVDLLASWSAAQDRALLLKLQLAAGRFVDAGRALLATAYSRPDLRARVQGMRAALEAFRDGEKHARLSPAARAQCAHFARSTEEQIALLSAQSALDAELDEKSFVLPGGGAGEAGTAGASSGSGGSSSSGGGLVDSSLAETLFRLLLAGEAAWSKRADKLAKDFRVGEAQYAFLRIRAFAQLRDWAGLWAMANERKSPVGYRPFAEACILGGSNMEAKRYVMLKMTEYGERLEVLALLGPTGLPESIELARAQKDLAKLEELAELAVTPQTRDAVEKAIAAVAR